MTAGRSCEHIAAGELLLRAMADDCHRRACGAAHGDWASEVATWGDAALQLKRTPRATTDSDDPFRSDEWRLARQRLAQRRIENAIGHGEEVNQLGDAPTDIAQLTDEGEVRPLTTGYVSDMFSFCGQKETRIAASQPLDTSRQVDNDIGMARKTASISQGPRARKIIGISLSPELASKVKAEAGRRQISLKRLFEELWELYERKGGEKRR